MFSDKHTVLPTISEQEFLPPINPWLSLGGMLLAITTVSAFILTIFLKSDVKVKAIASVRPLGEIQIVESTQEGTVKAIEVRENQFVEELETIAVLDDSQLRLRKIQLQDSLEKLNQQQQQIKNQLATLDSQIRAETERANRIIASLEAELAGNKREFRDNQSNSEKNVQESEAQLKQGEAELRISQARLVSTKAELKAQQEKLQRYALIAEVGAISQDRLREIELAVEQQKQAVEMQIQEIETRKQAIEVARLQQQRAKRALNPSNSQLKITQQTIAREKASLMSIQANLEREQEILIGQSLELQRQGDRENMELKQVEHNIQQAVITAPTTGEILKISLRNPNQRVQAGTEIAQISPQNAPLAINALVSVSDIHNIKIGQTAQIRISACPYPDYGTLAGVVKEISPDIFRNNEQSFYTAIIEPQNKVFGSANSPCILQAGMEGDVMIMIRQESVLRFILRKIRLITNI